MLSVGIGTTVHINATAALSKRVERALYKRVALTEKALFLVPQLSSTHLGF